MAGDGRQLRRRRARRLGRWLSRRARPPPHPGQRPGHHRSECAQQHVLTTYRRRRGHHRDRRLGKHRRGLCRSAGRGLLQRAASVLACSQIHARGPRADAGALVDHHHVLRLQAVHGRGEQRARGIHQRDGHHPVPHGDGGHGGDVTGATVGRAGQDGHLPHVRATADHILHPAHRGAHASLTGLLLGQERIVGTAEPGVLGRATRQGGPLRGRIRWASITQRRGGHHQGQRKGGTCGGGGPCDGRSPDGGEQVRDWIGTHWASMPLKRARTCCRPADLGRFSFRPRVRSQDRATASRWSARWLRAHPHPCG